uniref:Uncharacterized protein n=1 Tax=viral metagenome TaxID=1070528 RepID=A0A6C0DSF0_9ZZZZ
MNVDLTGKTVIYIDAEFQGYKVPKVHDRLWASGFQPTEPYTYTSEDEYVHRYHFLLSLGLYTLNDGVFELATFPSEYGRGEGFANVQILEPGYTTSAPDVAADLAQSKYEILLADVDVSLLKGAAREKRIEKLKFAFMSELNLAQQGLCAGGHQRYTRGRDFKERSLSNLVFADFIKTLKKGGCVLIHKGRNDLVALKNTCTLKGVELPPFENIDLDAFNHLHEGADDKKLNTLQELYSGRYPELRAKRDALLDRVTENVVKRWGAAAREGVAAHNPLVDCVYALVLYEGVQLAVPDEFTLHA